MPPRHGKSELCSKFFPTWFLGTFPEKNVILTSATGDLAGDFCYASLSLMLEHGRDAFGVQVKAGVRGRQKWQLVQGGSMRAAGVGGDIMGRGADLLIVDDYFKNDEEALSPATREGVHSWFMSTSSSRLTPTGAVVIIATRWHSDDLIGRLLKAQSDGGQAWRVLNFPAIASDDDQLGREPGEALFPELWPLEMLDQKRTDYVVNGYPWMWEALYQTTPPRMLDAEFNADYFPNAATGERADLWFDEWPVDDEIVFRIMALDPSKGRSEKNDYSAYVMLALTRDGTMYIDADLQRRPSTVVVSDGLRLASEFSPLDGFGVEVNQMQELFADLLATESKHLGMMLPLYHIHNNAPKITRIRSLTPYLARGEFRFKKRSPGVALLIEQLRQFPGGKHDDGPDALAQALTLARDLLSGDVARHDEPDDAENESVAVRG